MNPLSRSTSTHVRTPCAAPWSPTASVVNCDSQSRIGHLSPAAQRCRGARGSRSRRAAAGALAAAAHVAGARSRRTRLHARAASSYTDGLTEARHDGSCSGRMPLAPRRATFTGAPRPRRSPCCERGSPSTPTAPSPTTSACSPPASVDVEPPARCARPGHGGRGVASCGDGGTRGSHHGRPCLYVPGWAARSSIGGISDRDRRRFARARISQDPPCADVAPVLGASPARRPR